MFRGTTFDKLLDKATSHLLLEPDWKTIMQICDLIRQNDVTPRNALSSLRKKLNSSNPHTAMFAVILLESIVKNCGSAFHDELTTTVNCEILHELVKGTNHDEVRKKLLELIQAWNHAFRKNAKYSALKDTMNTMKAEGYQFPVLRETDAMFSADSAPVWADGEVCHRCRVPFTIVNRKHHCRACGQVFCGQCSAQTSTLPKFGIEKEVRVCDACYDQVNKPSTMTSASKDPEYEEYLKSSLAQQNQAPPKKSDDEIREEEELQLALALSQSEAEAKEKEKLRATSAYFKQEPVAAKPIATERSPSPEHPELARYLNRPYWESRPQDARDAAGMDASATSPLTQATAPYLVNSDTSLKENGVVDIELEEFVRTLKTQVEIFINRMKSNSSRGRSIANDSSVQTLFMNITAMHSRLLKYIQEHDDSRLYYERLQDKLTQVKDARAALDALREEHREKLRRQAEEAELQRQMLMAHKLEIMRKKKQEYLQYQRQLALQRIQEQEREMHMRKEQQKQQYMMGGPGGYYMGSPGHAGGGQYAPQGPPQGPPPQQQQPAYGVYNHQPMYNRPPPPPPQAPMGGMPGTAPMYGAPRPMAPMQQQRMPGMPTTQPNAINPPPHMQGPMPGQQPPPGMMPPNPMGQGAMMAPPGHGPPPAMMPTHGMGAPNSGMPYAPPPQQQQPPPPHQQQQQQQQPPGGMQPGAPPASPQMPKEESTTGELISFLD